LVFIPSMELHQELLTAPQFCRFAWSHDADGVRAVLAVKATTLGLKYLTAEPVLHVLLFPVAQAVGYAVVVNEGGPPALLWSVIQSDDEKAALLSAVGAATCAVHLFSEAAINVASGEGSVSSPAQPQVPITNATYPADLGAIRAAVATVLDQLLADPASNRSDLIEVAGLRWEPVSSVLVTANGGAYPVELFADNEGAQQEHLAVWLTEHLDPGRVLVRPQVQNGAATRELCDLLMSYSGGSFLIESKALSVLGRSGAMPSRSAMAENTRNHTKKAVNQVIGASKKLAQGAGITDTQGDEYHVDRGNPPHALILLSDVSLLAGHEGQCLSDIERYRTKSGGFLHFMDPSGLVRMSQAAAMLAAQSERHQPIEAFDALLIRRWRTVGKRRQINLDFRIEMEA